MPVQYPMSTPWIRGGADLAGSYAKGFGLGAQSGEAAARLNLARQQMAEQSNRQALEIALQQQKVERQSMVEQQKLQVAQAYHQQQGELQQQKLDQAERALQMKVKDAAARSLAFERYKADVASGAKPEDAALKNLIGVQGLGQFLGASMRAKQETQEYQPERIDIPGFPPMVYSRKTGTPHFAPADKTPKMSFNQSVDALNKLVNMSPKTFEKLGLDTNALRVLQQAGVSKAQQIASGTNGPQATAQSEVLPLPGKKSELITGKKYQTRYGIATWNGSNFTSEVEPMDQSQPEPETESDLDRE